MGDRDEREREQEPPRWGRLTGRGQRGALPPVAAFARSASQRSCVKLRSGRRTIRRSDGSIPRWVSSVITRQPFGVGSRSHEWYAAAPRPVPR